MYRREKSGLKKQHVQTFSEQVKSFRQEDRSERLLDWHPKPKLISRNQHVGYIYNFIPFCLSWSWWPLLTCYQTITSVMYLPVLHMLALKVRVSMLSWLYIMQLGLNWLVRLGNLRVKYSTYTGTEIETHLTWELIRLYNICTCLMHTLSILSVTKGSWPRLCPPRWPHPHTLSAKK